MKAPKIVASLMVASLIDELKAIKSQRYSTCDHGGIRYPVQWMPKTQEKAINNGYLSECEKCKSNGYRYLFILKR